MFTPQEVSEKVFPKASFGGGGYNMASVDEFLDALTEDYTALFKENVTLKAKLKVLAEKVEEYRSTEEAMRQALLTAAEPQADVVSAIEQDILSKYIDAPEEKGAGSAVTDEPTIKLPPVDGSAIPSDFRLSLDELKFGRNYSGNK